ncbi:hypothetical protein Pyrde_0968 [Pyrodictium delaneyi]|uniref:Amidohydrolase n=1 Tax=Pyrodictium delaneyi TaxID=1273541 RepID=A0A0P0N3E2_9CREN|nr:hypothetical protein [Pyrodictium delaneyi]ALL01016.1 hypothetical protein Pyrde_0968 [Pyrodictium delaneyi]OWJ55385.1 hypothetical protein Pdsh_00805 [Pyrodictium delaneyi]
MPLRILFYDVYIVDEKGAVQGPGYIHISAGTINYIGIGEPPEEAQYAELVAGGPGRVVYPGFAAPAVFLEMYPFRHLLVDVRPQEYPESKIAERVRSMSSREAYYAALMALHELSMHGYTRVVAVDPHIDAVARAIIDSGLEGAVLYPYGCSLAPTQDFNELVKKIEEYGIDRRRIRVGIMVCEDREPPEVVLEKAELVYTRRSGMLKASSGERSIVISPRPLEGAVPGPLYPHTASPWALLAQHNGWNPRDVYRALTQTLHEILEPGYRVYEKGRPAHIVVVDVSEPPGWLPTPEYAAPWSLSGSRPRVETIVSGGRLVVDGGEHLAVGSNAARQASEVLRQVLG